MASPVEVQIILCDAAVADPTGKVHMLGAGWSVTTSPTPPQAVAVLVKVPWDRANQRLGIRLQLVDSDGAAVLLETPQGQQGITTEGELEVGRPPGVAPGSLLDASFVVSLQPLPLPPGRYQWRLDVSEQTFAASFQVRQGGTAP
jgi:hypothetical protein